MTAIKVKNAFGSDLDIEATKTEDDFYNFVNVSKLYELAINQGEIDGVSAIDKFGWVGNVGSGDPPIDVWENKTEYIYDLDGTNPIAYLSSSSTADTMDVSVTGLDINGVEVVQTVTLTGQTPVTLPTALWRVYRMENEGNVDIVGNVYAGINPAPVGGVPPTTERRAIITNGNNQTLMALYTIPAGKVGFLYRGEIGAGLEGGGSTTSELADLCYKSRRFGKVFKIKKKLTLSINGSSTYQDTRSFPDIIPAKTDVRICVESTSTGMNIWSTLDILLVDESKFSPAFLAAIGQPS